MRLAERVGARVERFGASAVERKPRYRNVGERAARRVGHPDGYRVGDLLPHLAPRVLGENREARVRRERLCFGDNRERAVYALDCREERLATGEITERPHGAHPAVRISDRGRWLETPLSVGKAELDEHAFHWARTPAGDAHDHGLRQEIAG